MKEQGERLRTHDVDKLTGQLLLRDHGLPVPRIFANWQEAQKHLVTQRGIILARGRIVGQADNSLIDVLPTENVFSKDELKELIKEAREIVCSPGFVLYCQQLGLKASDLKPDYFCQEEILKRDVKIITMDSGDTIVMQIVNVGKRIIDRGFFPQQKIEYIHHPKQNIHYFWPTIEQILEKTLELHKRAKNILNQHLPPSAWQMEMVGTAEDLYIVQSRTVAQLPHEGICQLGLDDSEEWKTGFQEKLNQLGSFTLFDYVSGSAKKKGKLVRQQFEEFTKKNRPYFLILNRTLSDLLDPREIHLGNIKGIVFGSYPTNDYLLHPPYRLMHLVWQKGGLVIVDKSALFNLWTEIL